MSNALTLIRSLVIYSLCLPLAIFLGYLLAMPMDAMSLTVVIVTLSLPLVPLLLKHHHLLLFLFWNGSIMLFFLPGRPNLSLVMILVSLGLSLLQHILNRDIHFVSVPSITRPLLFLTLVIVVTGELTGGFGARLMGSESYGGKRYFYLLGAILGYFALSCFRVPTNKAMHYLALYLFGTLTSVVGNLAPYMPTQLYWLFALFPVESMAFVEGGNGPQRLGGLTFAALATVCYVMGRHGVRGLFDFGETWRLFPFRLKEGFGFNNPWRWMIFGGALWVAMLGGFRSIVIVFALIFAFQFYLEGLCRTQLLPALLLVGLLVAAVGLPMINRMPLMVQRSLSFLPVDVDPIARSDAEASSEWRLRMWQVVVPMIPQYLILGKGYAIDPNEMNMSLDNTRRVGASAAETAILVGDYHNGPLSLVIPLGVFGAIAFVWFVHASLRLLFNNYRYGDPELKQINTFLLAYFLARLVFFCTVFGSFHVEFMIFTGIVGVSVSFNGGMSRRPAAEPVESSAFQQFKLARAAR